MDLCLDKALGTCVEDPTVNLGMGTIIGSSVQDFAAVVVFDTDLSMDMACVSAWRLPASSWTSVSTSPWAWASASARSMAVGFGMEDLGTGTVVDSSVRDLAAVVIFDTDLSMDMALGVCVEGPSIVVVFGVDSSMSMGFGISARLAVAFGVDLCLGMALATC